MFFNNRFETHDDWLEGLEALVVPALKRYDHETNSFNFGPGRAQYSEVSQRLEGFSRIILGAAILSKARGDEKWIRPLIEGLKDGVDPEHPRYWGVPDDFDQRIVEMAGLALVIGLVPEIIWEKLDAKSQSNLSAWFELSHTAEPMGNNWILFRLIVNAVLHRLKHRCRRDPSEVDWNNVDQLYVGEGWYNDSRNGSAFDYYNSSGFHLYSLYVVLLHPKLSQDRRDLILERAYAHLKSLDALQSVEGSFIPYGRSLTYRFAPAAMWGVLSLIESDNYADYRLRISRNLKYWSKQSICDSGGLLNVGYAYQNQNMAENYNSPVGPYFCFHAFIPLLLSKDHSFWTTDPKHEIAKNNTPSISTIKSSGLIIVNDALRQHDWLLNGGQVLSWRLRHEAEKYAKFAYSARHGFQISGGIHGLNRLGFDSSIAVSEDEQYWRLRERPVLNEIKENEIVTTWSDDSWIEVKTRLSVFGGFQVRRHQILVKRPLWYIEGGWAFPVNDDRIDTSPGVDPSSVVLESGKWFSAIGINQQNDGEFGVVHSEPHLNVIYPLTKIPFYKEFLNPGRYERTLKIAGYGNSHSEWMKFLNEN